MNVIQLALGLAALVAFLVLVAIIPSWRAMFVGTFAGRKPKQTTRV